MTTKKWRKARFMTVSGRDLPFRFLNQTLCTLVVRSVCLLALLVPVLASGQDAAPLWTFAVSGDSRNCGDFVMPAIAVKVKAEGDTFYWHLGDFRWMSQPDQDLVAMQPEGHKLNMQEYTSLAWDDFLTHQMASFGSTPVFLGRGNHETVAPMTREGYIAKFSSFLDRPEIAAQRITDGAAGAPVVRGITGHRAGWISSPSTMPVRMSFLRHS
jgi:hypothetical protein